MKKILAAFLAAVMMLSICSCDTESKKDEESSGKKYEEEVLAGKTMKELYYSAVDYVKSLVNYEITIDALYRNTYLDETDTQSSTATQTVEEQKTTTVYKATDDTFMYSYKVDNGSYEEHFVFDGTTLYQSLNGIREQKKTTQEEFLDQYGSINQSGMLLELNDSSFEGIALTEKDGKHVLQFSISPEEYYDLVGGQTEAPVIYDVYFDENGKLLSFDRSIEYFYSEDWYVQDYMTVTIENVGKVDPITAPENASEYAIRPTADQIDMSAVDSLEDFELSDPLTDYVLIKFKVTAPTKTENTESATESATENSTEASTADEESTVTADTSLDGYEGEILIRLYPDVAPETVANFKKLIGTATYKGLEVNGIIDDFALQIGEHMTPEDFSEESTEEETEDDNVFEPVFGEFAYNGFTNNLSHKRGVISMLRGEDPNSATFECFICTADTTDLDGYYASFGCVVYGFETLDKIASIEVDDYDIPQMTVTIVATDFMAKKA